MDKLRLIAGVAMLLLCFAGFMTFAGCKPKLDRGRCLHEDMQIIMQPRFTTVCTGGACRSQMIGMFPQVIPVCRQWEFPSGRKDG